MTDTASPTVVFVMPGRLGRRAFPVGIATLAAILRKAGITVAVVDANAGQCTVPQVVDRVAALGPAIVALTGLWKNLPFQREVSQLLRTRCPAVRQVAGGWWSSPIPAVILAHTAVDCVVQGEADLVIADLCRALAAGREPDLPGVYTRAADGTVRDRGEAPRVRDLATLPYPAYDLFDMDYYIVPTPTADLVEGYGLDPRRFRERYGDKATWRSACIFSGRGCYGKCHFCAASGQVRRNAPPAYVVNHMELLWRTYGVDLFRFNESLTLSTRIWTRTFCDELLRRGHRFLYAAECRGDFLCDEETVALLARSGCIRISIGFESGNDTMLQRMGKATRTESYAALIERFRRHGIHVDGSIIFNMPGETRESLRDTVAFVRAQRLCCGCGFASPYPGTWLYDYSVEHGFIRDETRFILDNPARNKGRDDFAAYLAQFNYNGLAAADLLAARRDIDRLKILNAFAETNPAAYRLFRCAPPVVLDWLGAAPRVARLIRRLGRHA